MNKKISLLSKLFGGKKKEGNCGSFEIEEVKEEKTLVHVIQMIK